MVMAKNTPSCTPGGRALSVYEWRTSAWETDEAAAEMLAAAERLCVDTVHVDVTVLALEDRRARAEESLEVLLGLAADSPVQVGALAGDPWWTSPEGQVDAIAIIEALDRVNEASEAPITTLHLDVEPWGLNRWAENKSSLAGQYLDFVSAIVGARDGRSDSTSLHLSFLVPYWFEGGNGEAPLVDRDGVSDFPFQHLQSSDYQQVTWIVMAYRDHAGGRNGVLELLSKPVALLSDVGLALETAPVEPRSITFAGEALEDLDRELSIVWEADLGLSEIVINDFEHFRELAESTPA